MFEKVVQNTTTKKLTLKSLIKGQSQKLEIKMVKRDTESNGSLKIDLKMTKV